MNAMIPHVNVLTPNDLELNEMNIKKNCNPAQTTSIKKFSSNKSLSSVEVAGHLIRSSFKYDLNIVGFSSCVWVECHIVQVVFEDTENTIDIVSNCELSNSEGSTNSSTLNTKNNKNVLTLVSKRQASHVVLSLPFDSRRYFTVACREVFLPSSSGFDLRSNTVKFNYAQHDELFNVFQKSIDALACGDEVEVFRKTPFAAWYPAFVTKIETINGRKTGYLQVLTENANGRLGFIQQLTCDTLWRMASIPRLSLTVAGGIYSEIFKYTCKNIVTDMEEMEEILLFIKTKTGLLKAQFLTTLKPYHIVLVGLKHDIQTVKTLLIDILSTRSAYSVEERKRKRLQFLAARRDTYPNPHVLEFLIKDVYVGVVIGRRGEKLSHVAKVLQVEVRILPEDNGFRRVRIYGRQMKDLQQAKEALELVYQKIVLSDTTIFTLKKNLPLLKLISQRANLYFAMLNEKEKLLIICGIRRSLQIFRDRVRKVLSDVV